VGACDGGGVEPEGPEQAEVRENPGNRGDAANQELGDNPSQ
jgi:hypothetical protein